MRSLYCENKTRKRTNKSSASRVALLMPHLCRSPGWRSPPLIGPSSICLVAEESLLRRQIKLNPNVTHLRTCRHDVGEARGLDGGSSSILNLRTPQKLMPRCTKFENCYFAESPSRVYSKYITIIHLALLHCVCIYYRTTEWTTWYFEVYCSAT